MTIKNSVSYYFRPKLHSLIVLTFLIAIYLVCKICIFGAHVRSTMSLAQVNIDPDNRGNNLRHIMNVVNT